MTGQLLKVTTTPYQSIRFSQSARLVSSDSVDLERRKAIARMRAFQSQHSSGSAAVGASYDFVKQINRTFSVKAEQHATAPSSQSTGLAEGSSPKVANSAPTSTAASGSKAISSEIAQTAASNTVSSRDVQSAVSAESNSAYTMERGAFEFRVSNGDVAFLPPLTMTVMTQRPEVHFEYLGGHNYVPPEKFDDDGFMNLLA